MQQPTTAAMVEAKPPKRGKRRPTPGCRDPAAEAAATPTRGKTREWGGENPKGTQGVEKDQARNLDTSCVT
jgi:hypothetical protein